jgi:hypothetical protein
VFVLLLGLLLMGGCSGPYKGFQGETMYTGQTPLLMITPSPPLKVVSSGNTWARVDTDTNLKATASVDYAIYGEPDAKGLVRQSGHALVASFSTVDAGWDFAPESFARSNEVYLGAIKINGLEWVEHLLYENSEGDWVSNMWLNNGREVPERWIAKRWSRTYFGATRVVVEYREPMPECVEVRYGAKLLGRGSTFSGATSECGSLIKDFEERADRSFEILSSRGLENVPLVSFGAAEQRLTRPQGQPNMNKMAGTARARRVLKAWGDD